MSFGGHTYTHVHTLRNVIFFFYFIFKLYITLLDLPNIKMNPPQVYMCDFLFLAGRTGSIMHETQCKIKRCGPSFQNEKKCC